MQKNFNSLKSKTGLFSKIKRLNQVNKENKHFLKQIFEKKKNCAEKVSERVENLILSVIQCVPKVQRGEGRGGEEEGSLNGAGRHLKRVLGCARVFDQGLHKLLRVFALLRLFRYLGCLVFRVV